MGNPSTNIGHFVTQRALLNPDLEAFVDAETGARYTFAQLNSRINRTARMLADHGVGRGDRVALMMMNSVEFEECYFAIAKLGATAVPLNWRLVADELAFIVGDAGATTMVFGTEFADVVDDLRGRGTETGLTTFVQVGTDVREWATDYTTAQAAASDDEIDVATDADDLLYIMYTSG